MLDFFGYGLHILGWFFRKLFNRTRKIYTVRAGNLGHVDQFFFSFFCKLCDLFNWNYILGCWKIALHLTNLYE
jgi:hypothetical protein